MEMTAQEIASIVNGNIIGDETSKINNISKIEEGQSGDLCFLSNLKYIKYIYSSKASIILVNKNLKINKKVKATLIKVDDAYLSFSNLIKLYNKPNVNQKGISKKTNISKSAILGKNIFIDAFTSISNNVRIEDNVQIHTNCYIGNNVEIGKNSILFPGVKVYENCKIGENNIIHAGAIIGADGFGFAVNHEKKYSKISQIGNVITHNKVEIGANTTIDRATIGSTLIKEGVKLDNLIQIGHNVEIGEHTVIAGLTGIAGSTKIGKNCMIGGHTAIAGHLKIGDNVKIAGHSGVGSNITDNKTIQGTFAFDIKKFQRSYVLFKRLPEIYNMLTNITKKSK